MSDPIELHPALVLGAFCEGLVGGGRRVALLGDGTTGLAARLAEACGRRVHVYDPDAQRVAAWFAHGQPDSAAMSYALFEADLDVRAGAFDVVVVPDLTAFPSAESALAAARAFAGGRGVAVVASPNPEHGAPARAAALAGAVPARALAYLALYDLCHAAFPAVKVLGQAPFAGHAFADFAAKDPAVTIDTSLCTTTEEPAWFVLVLGERPPAVDPYTLVQVPVTALAAPAPTDPAELAAARLRTTVLEGELDKLRERERD
ncbi:MAG: hypothetical protein HY908_29765, partial [Myxococcales bacterium]|nr:hypothetical protein [Myxococcales bacterium]